MVAERWRGKGGARFMEGQGKARVPAAAFIHATAVLHLIFYTMEVHIEKETAS